ncbi:MAG: hypothetical protein JO043_01125 [Candidatus Eremiobacteraeota bacterium]|nr:hypothetical protein [Candidatus Eremiobacteraeota bacterium]
MKTFAFVLTSTFAVALGLQPGAAQVTTLPAPTVVVYPFTVGGNANPDASGRMALLFATRLTQAGGLNVKPATPGIQRAQFLQFAKAQGADYYVTGYLTPLGDSVSLLDQVVSTYSGIVVWSNTTEIQTYADASGQADLIRDAILRHAGRTLAALDQPAPIPQSTPAPTSSNRAGQANLSGLFRRRSRATPAPRPAGSPPPAANPSPAPLRPRSVATRPPAPPPPPALVAGTKTVASSDTSGRPAIVVAVNGSASDADRSYAASALASAVAKAGLGGMLVGSRTTSEVPAHARELCAQNHATAIYGGNLSIDRVGAALTRASAANFELLRYDCGGTMTARELVQAQASGRAQTTVAIQRAVEKSLDAALHLAKTKHT